MDFHIVPMRVFLVMRRRPMFPQRSLAHRHELRPVRQVRAERVHQCYFTPRWSPRLRMARRLPRAAVRGLVEEPRAATFSN